MMPPTKDQADIGVDNPMIDASDRPGNKDQTRQEGKDEADINYMLSRFGVTQPRGTPTFGVWDDTVDLQNAITATREARAGFANLPKVLRDKFGTMEEFLRAVENGSLVIKDEEEPAPVKSEMDKLNDRLAEAEKQLRAATPTP